MELLESYPSLRHAPETLRNRLREEGIAASVAAGQVVFEPADFAVHYPFLLEGTARVLKVGSTPRDTLLYRLRPGEHCLLSSSGLLARWRFGARVVAESDLRAVLISGKLFRTLVRECPEFAQSVYVAIARRLEVVLDLVEQARLFSLERRVAACVLALGPDIPSSHQELADDLSASRENVSRVLEGFQARGWVRLGRRRIETIDPSALEALLDQNP
ncbi:MAG TPA: Crp/Fnr family transcriptional regulator [Candidatus Polarisedimenticolaceae bacterium]|jgi:CRP/FNR family transcriptional regulator